MVEHHENLLGPNREEADCEVCPTTIDLHRDDYVLFAIGLGDGHEGNYRVAPLCSADCVSEYVGCVLRDHDRQGHFASWEQCFAEFEARGELNDGE